MVVVTVGKKKSTYETKNILIATGSDSAPLPGVEVDEKQIVTSTGAIASPKVPKHLVVIGGGVIGLELGSVWARFGAKVTVVEFLDRILPTNDGEVSKQFERILKKQGFEFRLSTKVTGAKMKTGVRLTVEPAAGGNAETIKADVVLLSIGRVPYTEGLASTPSGSITWMRAALSRSMPISRPTYPVSTPSVIASRDPCWLTKRKTKASLSRKSSRGSRARSTMTLSPNVYTWPEVASVGKTEEELKEAGRAYKAAKFPFMANSRARCNGDTDGFVKVLADAETDEVLGCHIVGADAGNLIQEIVTVIEFGGSAEDIARTCHGHPTMTEAVKEAALAVDGRPIHI